MPSHMAQNLDFALDWATMFCFLGFLYLQFCGFSQWVPCSFASQLSVILCKIKCILPLGYKYVFLEQTTSIQGNISAYPTASSQEEWQYFFWNMSLCLIVAATILLSTFTWRRVGLPLGECFMDKVCSPWLCMYLREMT